MHYNENSNRKQASTKEGVDRWNIIYPKANNGEKAVARQIKESSTHSKLEASFQIKHNLLRCLLTVYIPLLQITSKQSIVKSSNCGKILAL
jgi:hypothetical protein